MKLLGAGASVISTSSSAWQRMAMYPTANMGAFHSENVIVGGGYIVKVAIDFRSFKAVIWSTGAKKPISARM